MALAQLLFSLAALVIIVGAAAGVTFAALASVRRAFERMGVSGGLAHAVQDWPGALQRLAVGDARNLGKADDVAKTIARDSGLVGPSIEAMGCEHPILAARAAHALDLASTETPAILAEHGSALLDLMDRVPHTEVRWRAARMVPRLMLDDEQRTRATKLLAHYTGDSSGLVTNAAMKALKDMEAAQAKAAS